jgi:protein TonB
MKSNLLIPCLIAIAVHALLFILPLHRVGSSTASLVSAPMSLSIVSPETILPAAPSAQIAEDSRSKLLHTSKEKPSLEETLPPRKDSFPDKQPVATRAVEPGPSEDKGGGDHGKPPVGGVAVGNALVPADTPTDLQKGLASLGKQQGQDVIVYARPRYKENPLPHYPKAARRRGYEGQTLLRVEVLETGTVGKIEIAASSGFEVLDEAALRSVRVWTFVPGTKNGEKIDQWVMVPVRFSLK